MRNNSSATSKAAAKGYSVKAFTTFTQGFVSNSNYTCSGCEKQQHIVNCEKSWYINNKARMELVIKEDLCFDYNEANTPHLKRYSASSQEPGGPPHVSSRCSSQPSMEEWLAVTSHQDDKASGTFHHLNLTKERTTIRIATTQSGHIGVIFLLLIGLILNLLIRTS